MDRKRVEIHALLNTNTHSKHGTRQRQDNMGQDNNSLAENVHNMMSGTLGQWIGKE